MSKVYKLCDCGFMNIFEDSEIAPRKCFECTRSILQKEIFSLEEYERKQEENQMSTSDEAPQDSEASGQGIFKLVNLEKNIEIILPEHDECIIGREALGGEFFGKTISRKHLYVVPTGRLGIRVTDKESLNGTKVNDEILSKGITKIVVPGNTITLDINESGITLTLQRIE